MNKTDIDTHVVLNKEFRCDIDAVIQRLKVSTGDLCPTDASGQKAPHPYNVRKSRERLLCLTKLQEAVMWLGMDLKALNESRPTEDREQSPYPSSYDPSTTKVEPVADGLKL